MKYYEDIQYIARVNKEDNIEGKIERWQAHKENILHRALTIAVFIGDSLLLQHRKHPVFNNVFDTTVSTHQIFVGDNLESDEEAIYRTLERELHIKQNDLLKKPENKGSVIYEAQDPYSNYCEHEVCHIFACTVQTVPNVELDFAYGYSLQKLSDLASKKSPLYHLLAPWAKMIIEEKKI